jgi:membrane protein
MIPSTKVAFGSALTGAITGAVLWELAKWGFKTWANYSVRNSIIYGSLFLIPLLLVWLYVGWLIIMITMETAYVHNHRKEQHIRYNAKGTVSDSFSLLITLYLKIAEFFYTNAVTQSSLTFLSEKTGIADSDIEEYTNNLIKEKLILKSEEGYFLPSVSPDKMLLSKLISILSGMESNNRESIADFCRGGHKELNNRTVSDLINHNDQNGN